MADELWSGDDQMPSCGACLEGHHHGCHDLIVTPPYGVHACGCSNPICADVGP